MAIDLHKKPFDESTKVKLSLYGNYIKEWLPVFLSKHPKYNNVNIFDFFCGPGVDENGEKGSPLITIEFLNQYIQNITDYDVKVTLFFNDHRKKKITALKQNLSSLYPNEKPYNVVCSSEDFDIIFKKYTSIMKKQSSANFLFLDQNGIKHITSEVFLTIIHIPATDFLFFTSSSTLNRFKDHPEIKKYIHITPSDLSTSDYCHIHRLVLEYYRDLIPRNREYYLVPFSIKKGANIYGLIFGTRHLLGIDKFISQCWKIDPQTGDSNFDIDKDKIDNCQLPLFKPKKVQGFESDLEKEIMIKNLKTNKDIYKYALFNGFKAEHARKVVSKLMKKGVLPKQGINISYNSCKFGVKDIPILYE